MSVVPSTTIIFRMSTLPRIRDDPMDGIGGASRELDAYVPFWRTIFDDDSPHEGPSPYRNCRRL